MTFLIDALHTHAESAKLTAPTSNHTLPSKIFFLNNFSVDWGCFPVPCTNILTYLLTYLQLFLQITPKFFFSAWGARSPTATPGYAHERFTTSNKRK